MSTDWKLVRELMNSAIDACEKIDAMEIKETERHFGSIHRDESCVYDWLISSYIFPENTMFDVIRSRHQLNQDNPYQPEIAKVLENVSKVCAQLVGANNLDSKVKLATNKENSIRELVENLTDFYNRPLTQQLDRILKESRVKT